MNRISAPSRLTLLALFLFVIGLAGAPSLRAQVLNEKVTSKKVVLRKVVILPAKVDVVRSGMKGPEGMAAESEELSTRVQAAVAAVLADKKRISRGESPLSGGGDPQANYRVSDLQAKFDDLLPKLIKKSKDVKTGRFTLGDEVLNLGVDKGTDAIVFIRGTGQTLTGGKKAFTLLVGGAPAYLSLQIGFIDAHTGDVLVYTQPGFVGDPTTAVEKLSKALEKSFKKIPAN